jgi:Ca2+-transporting ATPase
MGSCDRYNIGGLIFAGMAGMYDPPRKEAAEAVLKCRLSGIKPVMITGDHKGTAAAVAKETGILQEGDIVMTGKDLDEKGAGRLHKLVGNVSVYARVTPAHKLDIVKALKKAGHIVAMTGDGVNDAPAVREADIGISMGINGTDVTREASSMILLDDNFSTIVAAVEEGRIIYNNIRKFIRYLLSCNIGEVLTMFIGMLLGLPIVLLPIQILWVNLVTDGLPAIALGLEPGEREFLKGKVRKPNESIFSGGLSVHIISRGILIALSTLAVFISIQYFTGQIAVSRTAAFVTLVMAQLMHVFECKSENKSIFEIPIFNNTFLVFAVACSAAMILSVVYLPFLQPIFKTVPLSLNEWAFVLGFSALGPVFSGLFRKGRRKFFRNW